MDGETSSKWPGDSIVATAHSAYVACRGTNTGEVIWKSDGDVKVLSLGLRETVYTRDVVGDSQVLRNDTGVSSLVEIARVWTSTIGVDLSWSVVFHGYIQSEWTYLMNGNDKLSTALDLCDCAGSQGILGVLTHIDVTGQFCSTTLVDNVCIDFGITDDGGILLARADTGAVTCDIWVDCLLSVCADIMKSMI